MRRTDGWEERLQVVLSTFAGRPFEYGFHDCALFVCNCVREMTGEDPATAHRNRYKDRKGALGILNGCSLELTAEQIALALGADEVRPLFAQRGDVVLVDTDQGLALAIVDLTGEKAVGAGPDGLVFWKLSTARRAWRI